MTGNFLTRPLKKWESLIDGTPLKIRSKKYYNKAKNKKVICFRPTWKRRYLKAIFTKREAFSFKKKNKRTVFKAPLAEILFNRYPDLERAYKLPRSLARFNQTSKVIRCSFNETVSMVQRGSTRRFYIIQHSI